MICLIPVIGDHGQESVQCAHQPEARCLARMKVVAAVVLMICACVIVAVPLVTSFTAPGMRNVILLWQNDHVALLDWYTQRLERTS